MTSTPINTPNKGRSLDRQITTKDVDCLMETFALFDNDRKEDITTMELGKVMHKT
jgi:Ca2+-binding EF-hand superfamily protein